MCFEKYDLTELHPDHLISEIHDDNLCKFLGFWGRGKIKNIFIKI